MSEHGDGRSAAEVARDLAKQLARALKLPWWGVGQTDLAQLESGRSVWRVYDDCWGVGGGYADIDGETKDLVHIQESEAERSSGHVIPPEFVPDDEELIAFATQRLKQIGWQVPGLRVSRRADLECHWELSVDAVAPTICVDVGGRRGNLRVKRLSRH
jgi:hypothetical protein